MTSESAYRPEAVLHWVVRSCFNVNGISAKLLHTSFLAIQHVDVGQKCRVSCTGYGPGCNAQTCVLDGFYLFYLVIC